MSDASKDIAAQFAAAGLVPGELVPQGGVSKVYVDTQDALLQEGINSVAELAASAQQTANTAAQAAGQAQTTATTATQRAEQAFTEAASAFGISEQALAQSQKNAAPSFNRINEIEATDVRTQMFIVGGVGITVTTDPITKRVTITATGTATPGPHAASHLTGGSDPIPVATETADGLQSKENFSKVKELSNPPRADYRSTVTKPAAPYTWVSPDWNSKNADNNSFVDPQQPSVVKTNTSGVYLIQSMITIQSNVTGQRNIRIIKNDDASIPSQIGYSSNRGSENSTRINVTALSYFNAGETFAIQAYQDAGPSITLNIEYGLLTVISVSPP